jgi:hypothetical protein
MAGALVNQTLVLLSNSGGSLTVSSFWFRHIPNLPNDEAVNSFQQVHCNREGFGLCCVVSCVSHRALIQVFMSFFFEWIPHNLKKLGKSALNETFVLLLNKNKREYQECLLISPEINKSQ